MSESDRSMRGTRSGDYAQARLPEDIDVLLTDLVTILVRWHHGARPKKATIELAVQALRDFQRQAEAPVSDGEPT